MASSPEATCKDRYHATFPNSINANVPILLLAKARSRLKGMVLTNPLHTRIPEQF